MNTEVSSFQGVEIEEFHHIQRCPHLGGVPLCTEVSSFQGVGIEGLYCINIKWAPNINTVVFVMVEKSVHRVTPHTQ